MRRMTEIVQLTQLTPYMAGLCVSMSGALQEIGRHSPARQSVNLVDSYSAVC